MDFPYIVDGGLDQMLSLVADDDSDTLLDVWFNVLLISTLDSI